MLISVDGRELHSVPALIRAMERAQKANKQELRIELLRKRRAEGGCDAVVKRRWTRCEALRRCEGNASSAS